MLVRPGGDAADVVHRADRVRDETGGDDLDVVVAEKLGEDEPRVRRALADAAVGDDRLVPTDARVRIELLELVGGAEGAVLGCCLAPRDVGGPGDVTGHLCLLLREVRRGEEVAAELLGRADVDPRPVAGLDGVEIVHVRGAGQTSRWPRVELGVVDQDEHRGECQPLGAHRSERRRCRPPA